MSKRSATSNLTKDNWDQDEEGGEIGVFEQAASSVLKSRVIKKAKRRTETSGDVPAVFTNFTAFGTSSSTGAPAFSFGNGASKTPAFSFGQTKEDQQSSLTDVSKENKSPVEMPLNKSPVAPSSLKLDAPLVTNKSFSFGVVPSNDKTSSDVPKTDTKGSTVADTKSPESQLTKKDLLYFKKLKSLNTQVLQWIKKHVEETPYINLSPIFADYTKHLTRLKMQSANSESSTDTLEATKPASFDFGEQKATVKNVCNSEIVMPLSDSVDKAAMPPPKFGYHNSNLSDSFLPLASTKSTNTFSFGASQAPKSSTTTGFSSKISTPSSGYSYSPSTTSTGFSFKPPSSGTSFSYGDQQSQIPAKSEFSFAAPTPAQSESSKDEDEEPPKVECDVKEEGSTYEVKMKLFYYKDDGYAEKGVGMLFLKPAGEKTQLIVRAMNSLGSILLNIVLNSSIPIKRMGKNNVMIMCVPNPPIDQNEPSTKPISMLIRVKTSQAADELAKTLEEAVK